MLRGVGVIQGDGIGHKAVAEILAKATEERYSAQNIAFGMGAGLLQNVNRDTMSFATKLCHIVYQDGTPRFGAVPSLFYFIVHLANCLP